MLGSSFANANSLGTGGPQPSLILDFLSGELDPRVTHTRGSHATYFNSSGVLDWAPNNTLSNSNAGGAVVVPGGTGTLPTSWSINGILSSTYGILYAVVGSGTEGDINYVDVRLYTTSVTTTTGSGVLAFAFESAAAVPASIGQTWTSSVYCRLISGSFTNFTTYALRNAERDSGGNSIGLTETDLKTATAAALSSQRFSATRTFTQSLTTYTNSAIYISFNSGVVLDVTVRFGLPQHELGSTARAPIKTYGTPYYGPRFDYDPDNVLRQNLFTYSEQFDNAIWFKPTVPTNLLTYSENFDNSYWSKSRSVLQTNQIRNNTMVGASAPSTAPTNWGIYSVAGLSSEITGTGRENGIWYIELRVYGTTNDTLAGLGSGIAFPENTSLIGAAIGQTWTASCYFRLVAGSFTNLNALNWNCPERNVGGAPLAATSTNLTTIITSAALDTQRVAVTRTFNNSSTVYTSPSLSITCNSGVAVDFTIRIGMPQLVLGDVAGDIVATSDTALPVRYLAPNGAVTAYKLLDDIIVNNVHYLGAGRTTGSNETLTLSVYAKAGEYNYITLQFSNLTNYDVSCTFNLTNGNVIFISGNNADYTGMSGYAVSVGSGWYRCVFTATKGSVNTTNRPIIFLTDSTGSIVFNGTGKKGVYLWGAQLNDSTLRSYHPTTATTSNRSTTEIQTNLITYSSNLTDPNWGKYNSAFKINQIRNNTMVGAARPETLPTNWSWGGTPGTLVREVIGTGTSGGINYVDIRFIGTTSSTSTGVYFEGNTAVAASVGQTWTSSVYASVVGGSTTNISSVTMNFVERGSGGTGLIYTGQNIAISNSLQRFNYTRTFTDANVIAAQSGIGINFASGVAIDITLRVGMPQLVLGNTAEEVVATSGTAQPILYTAPDSTKSAYFLVENNAVGASHEIYKFYTTEPDTTYTFSIYAKAGTRSKLRINPNGSTYAWSQTVNTASMPVFNLTTGTIDYIGTLSPTMVSVGDGWYRCSLTIKSNYSTSAVFYATLIDSSLLSTYQGDSVSGLYLWGPQLVKGNDVGEYRATTSSVALATLHTDPRGDKTAQVIVPAFIGGNNCRATFTSYARLFPFNTPITFSCYAKLPTGTTSTGIRLQIECPIDGVYLGAQYSANLTGTPSFTVTQYDLSSTSRIVNKWGSLTNVGNGWYRCSITWMFTGNAPPNGINCSIWPHRSEDIVDVNTSTALIWGAQLQVGRNIPDQYITTTSSTYTECKPRGLLIEPSTTNGVRNNTMQGAVVGTPGTLPTNWSTYTTLTGLSTQVVSVSTDTLTGIPYMDFRIYGTPNTGGAYEIWVEGFDQIVAATGQVWILSGYFLLQSGSTNGVNTFQITMHERDSVGGFISAGTSSNYTLTSNWQRAQLKRTLSSASTTRVNGAYKFLFDPVPVDITIRIALPQLERVAGTQVPASLPILTYGSAVTRNSDSVKILGKNFSNWFNPAAGTFLCESSAVQPDNSNSLLLRDTFGNYDILYGGGSIVRSRDAVPNFVLSNTTTITSNTPFKSAMSYESNVGRSITFQGLTPVSGAYDNSYNTMTGMIIGQNGSNSVFLTGHIRSIKYYQWKMSDNDMQKLTSS